MRRAALLVLAAALGAAGCGVDPAALPIPGTYVAGEKYAIHIELSSALNLPAKAKVVSQGVDVGVLDRVELIGSGAVATVDLKNDVRLPISTRAELRQATILGEIYISLLPPADAGAPYLTDGDTIPRSRTAPADNVEDLLRGLSSFVSGGRFGELAEVVDEFNAAFPADDGDFVRIYSAGQNALHDLVSHTDDLDRILEAAASITTELNANSARVDEVLQYGPARAEGLSTVVFGVVELLFRLQELSGPLSGILAPIEGDLHDVIGVIAPATLTIAGADTTVPMNADTVDRLLRDKLIPFFSAAPDVHIDPSGLADRTVLVLRSIGMVR